jgi:Phytanoyl-CoA dioxygenase (PhyH)
LPFQPAPLSPTEIQRFHDDGYVVVRSAFSPDDARAMQDEWWSELGQVHGIERDDRTTWRRILSDLKAAKHSPIQQKIATARVRGVIDALLGPGAWRAPADWGRPLVTFPERGGWDVPIELWHWDSDGSMHRDALNALFVVSFIGSVAPRSGGTLILSGSPRLLRRHEDALTPDERQSDARTRRRLFHRSHPWLMALTGQAPSPPDRIAAFMGAETDLGGVPVQVVELTGGPGDMVFCHPTMVHSVSPNRGSEPRFMRIKQQVLTHAGWQMMSRGMHPR